MNIRKTKNIHHKTLPCEKPEASFIIKTPKFLSISSSVLLMGPISWIVPRLNLREICMLIFFMLLTSLLHEIIHVLGYKSFKIEAKAVWTFSPYCFAKQPCSAPEAKAVAIGPLLLSAIYLALSAIFEGFSKNLCLTFFLVSAFSLLLCTSDIYLFVRLLPFDRTWHVLDKGRYLVVFKKNAKNLSL